MSESMKPGIRYHYVITVQFETVNGVQQVSYGHGVILPAPGETRSDVFRHLFQQRASRGSSPVPLFFSLEPEDLTAIPPRDLPKTEDRKDS